MRSWDAKNSPTPDAFTGLMPKDVVSCYVYLRTMKHCLTLLLVGLTTLVSAQNDGWQYTFPYNPDGNNDGYISLEVTLNYFRILPYWHYAE